MSLFLYGITAQAVELSELMIGVSDAPVRRIESAHLLMLVSDYDGLEVSPRRKNLSAFQRVLNEVSASNDMLPAAFGMLAQDEEEVQSLLDRHAQALVAELARIKGAVEYSLRLRFVGENLFADFIERFADLRALRDRAFAGGKAPTQDQRIDLGQGFERLLQTERGNILATAVKMLTPSMREWMELSFDNETLLLSLAVLVDRSKQSALDSAVEQFAKEFNDDWLLELLGPWPPYSFAELRLG